MSKTALVAVAAAAFALSAGNAGAQKKYGPGVSDKEILLGQTIPYSGPLSSYGTHGRAQAAYFEMINAQGGVNGRRIRMMSLDDGYSPPRTIEQTRKLVEGEKVLAIAGTMGTPTNSAIVKYLNANKVPHVFLATGASKWGNPKTHPWTMGWYPTYRSEGEIFAKYIKANIKDAKIGILSQNDDYGRDFVEGFKRGLGADGMKLIVKEVTYETADPNVDSQIIALQSSGANVLFSAVVQKFAAQAIRKTYDIGWKPTHFLVQNANSISSVLQPAGVEKSIGIVSSAYLKDPADPQFASDPGVRWYRDFMAKYYPQGDVNDPENAVGVMIGATIVQALKQCGDDLSRENFLRQAASLKDVDLPLLLPGIKVSTGPNQFFPIRQRQLVRFDGRAWVRFGDVMSSN
jgi:ABC-type branched-subunit amino acid transport system substrate-binding protein